MLALSSSYELATTYLQVYLLWVFCSELVLSFACVYFVITGHFSLFDVFQFYARTSHPLKNCGLKNRAHFTQVVQVCCANAFWLGSHILPTFLFLVVQQWLQVSIHGTTFSLLFSNVFKLLSSDLQLKFTVYIWTLALGIRFIASQSYLGDLRFHNIKVTACTFQFMGTIFLYFFQNFLNFYFRGQVQGSALGLDQGQVSIISLALGQCQVSVSVSIKVRFQVYLLFLLCFYQSYCILLSKFLVCLLSCYKIEDMVEQAFKFKDVVLYSHCLRFRGLVQNQGLGVAFSTFLLSLLYSSLDVPYCYVTCGCQIRFQITRSSGDSVATAFMFRLYDLGLRFRLREQVQQPRLGVTVQVLRLVCLFQTMPTTLLCVTVMLQVDVE